MASIETPSKIKLISDALVLLGEKPASSLTEDRYGVTVGANLFERIYETELQSHRWRFAMKKNALSRLVAEPLNEFRYAFNLPSDCLLPIGKFPAGAYEIYGRHVYANQSEIDFEYMFKPEVSELPAYFALLMTYALAKDMIKPITESDSGVNIMTVKYNVQRNRAMFADSQGRPNRTIAHSPFTQVR